MTELRDSDDFREGNVSRLIAASVAAGNAEFETKLRLAVLTQVGGERRRALFRRVSALAAAAVLLLSAGALLTWRGVDSTPTARVITTYGLVRMTDGAAPVPVTTEADLMPDRGVDCAWGSAADIVLRDKSVLRAGSKTSLSVDEGRFGAKVALAEGALSVRASKQDKGKSLTIETPGAELSVLGTAFDVMVFPRASGGALTDVRVSSGKVTLSSGGKSVTLRANMQGLVEEGKPPVARSLTWEVNEIARLWDLARKEASASGRTAAAPALVDVSADGSATVWTVEMVANKSATPLVSTQLRAKAPVSGIAVFTADGAPVPSRTTESLVEVDLSLTPIAPGGEVALVVRIPSVATLLPQTKPGVYSFDSPGAAGKVSAVEFRYDDSIRLLACEPRPVEIGRAGDRSFAVFVSISDSVDFFE